MRPLWGLFICGCCVLGVVVPARAQGTLENPQPGSLQSGIGLVSGWRCSAGTLTLAFDTGPPTVVAYGTSRRDTLVANGGPCTSEFSGFGLLINWNLLGNGPHSVKVFDKGVQFASATFTVTTLGGEFLKGLSGVCELNGFPQLGKEVSLQWQESNQNFTLASVSTSTSLISCRPDAVPVGLTCVDKYEASVWLTTDATVIGKIRAGTVTLAELQAGAIRKGATMADYGQECPADGNNCQLEFAVSLAGVLPSATITWFQAVAACRNAGKRLLSNAEWQAAALGTPDPGDAPGSTDCNTKSAGAALTGARAKCVSNVGAFDLVGNVWEWVADWVPRSTACGSWGPFSDDSQCLAGADSSPTTQPGALIRGGFFVSGTGAGVFAVLGGSQPSSPLSFVGFRCGR